MSQQALIDLRQSMNPGSVTGGRASLSTDAGRVRQGRTALTSVGSSRHVVCGPAATHNDLWATRTARPPAPVKRCTALLVRGSMWTRGTLGALIHTEAQTPFDHHLLPLGG